MQALFRLLFEAFNILFFDFVGGWVVGGGGVRRYF